MEQSQVLNGANGAESQVPNRVGRVNNPIESVEDASSTSSVYLFILSSQSNSSDDIKYLLNLINSSLNQIGTPLINFKEEMLNALRAHQIEQTNFDQQYVIAYSNEQNFDFELLINSSQAQFRQSFKNFVQSKSSTKYFINATHDYNQNGDLNLQDSLFTCDDFQLILSELSDDSKKSFKSSKCHFYFPPKTAELNRNWKLLLEKQHSNISITPIQSNPTEAYSDFLSIIEKFYNTQSVDQLMETSKCTGTLKISKPCLYIFPASQGDSAYFTINGYSMLINGGYDRLRPCFWKFVNMLQQIDSVLVTHNDSDALAGLSSFFQKKLSDPEIKPNVLSVLGNLIPTHKSDLTASPTKGVSQEINKGQQTDTEIILEAIDKLRIKLMPLIKSTDNLLINNSALNKSSSNLGKYEHVNLYYKLGHGSLDLYVLSPFLNSPEFKEFCQQQSSTFVKHQKSHLAVNQIYRNLPMSHLASAVVLLIWLPAYNSKNPSENNALRLLFTGNAPQNILFSALDKLKDFELLNSPVYKVKSTEINPLANLVKKPIVKETSQVVKENGSSALNGVSKPNKPAVNGNHNDSILSEPAKTAKPTTNGTAASSSARTAKPPKPSTSTTSASAPVADKPKETKVEKKASSLHETSFSKSEKVEKKPARPSVSSTATNGKKETENKPTTSAPSTSRPSLPISKAESKPAAAAKPAASAKPPAAKPVSAPAPVSKETSAKKPTTSKAAAPSAAKKETKSAKTLSVSVDQTTAAAAASITGGAVVAAVATTVVAQAVSNEETNNAKEEVKEEVRQVEADPVLERVELVEHVETVEKIEQVEEVQTQPESVEPEIQEQQIEIEHIEQVEVEVVEQVIEQEVLEPEPIVNNHQTEEPEPECEHVEEANEPEVEAEVEQQTEPAESLVNEVCEQNGSEEVEVESEQTESAEHVEHAEHVEQTEQLVELAESVEQTAEQAESVESTEQVEHQVEELEPEVEQEPEQESENVNTNLVDIPSYSNESPNLSPVKKDFMPLNGVQQTTSEEIEAVPVSEEQIVINEDCNQNELEIVSGNLNGELKTSESEHHNFLNSNDDVMTRSFIEDSSNPQSNPFIEQPIVKTQVLNESCDLNRTHELFEGEESNAQESNLEDTNKSTDDSDKLINEIESLKIIDQVNGHTNGHMENPASWNLLELPTPVNPNDVGQNLVQPSIVDKKSTPNGKKPAAPVSPSTISELKSLNKNSANTHSAKSVKSTPIHPAYVELAYTPAHGNGHYCDVEFFKRVRARHYVLSSLEPSEAILNALLDAKETWEDKNLPVSLIPTYESDLMRRWFVNNEERLNRLKIEILPAAKYATITMDENPDLSCQVYKLEF